MRVLLLFLTGVVACGDDAEFIDSSFPDAMRSDAATDAFDDVGAPDVPDADVDATTLGCIVDGVYDVAEVIGTTRFDLAASSRFVIVWDEMRAGQPDVFARAYDAAGLSEEARITDSFDRTESPTVLAFDDAVWVAYQDNRELDYEIFLERRAASDLSLVDVTRVTDRSGRDEHPSLVWVGSNAWIAWIERDVGASRLEAESIAATGELSGSQIDVAPDRTPTRPRARLWNDGAAFAFFEPGGDGGDAWITTVSATGDPIATSRISTSSEVTGGVDVAWSGDGGAAVFDASNAVLEPSVNVSMLDADGTPTGAPMMLDVGRSGSIVALSEGFLVAYRHAEALHIARLDPDGRDVERIEVGAASATSGETRLARATDGRVLVVWSNADVDTTFLRAASVSCE